MRKTEKTARSRRAAFALAALAFCLLAGACSSGPKVIHLGAGDASRVTIQTP